MKKLTLCQRIRWAAIHCPTLLPSIINDPRFDKRITIGILHDLLPRRTSIEIECCDSLNDAFSVKGVSSINDLLNEYTYPKLLAKYKVLGFSIEQPQGQRLFARDYSEHKISIKNYTQLVGLYNILNDMKKHCSLNTASGCHIHLDIDNPYTKPDNELRYDYTTRLQLFFTKQCENGTIESIFGTYSGEMMYKKRCVIYDKNAWVNISTKNTLEFRTAPMTFDYSTIITWFIAVNKLLNQFEYTLRHKDKQKESPNKIYEAC